MQYVFRKLSIMIPILITGISFAPVDLSAYERPIAPSKITCVSSIDRQRRLVDTLYGEIEGGERSYLVRLSEKIVKESARPEDLKWHKGDCLPKRPVIIADILRQEE